MGSISKRLTTTVSTKGQVILPKAIRDHLHWPPGTRLTVEDVDGGVILKPAALFAPAAIDQVFGTLDHDGPALSLEAMDAAIAAEAKRRARD